MDPGVCAMYVLIEVKMARTCIVLHCLHFFYYCHSNKIYSFTYAWRPGTNGACGGGGGGGGTGP